MTQDVSKKSHQAKRGPHKEYWKAAFQGTGRNPDSWRYRAGILKKAADLVLTQMKADEDATVVEAGWVDSVYKYLAGMTVEIILKGIIVAGNPDLISEERIMGGLDRHNTCLLYTSPSPRDS